MSVYSQGIHVSGNYFSPGKRTNGFYFDSRLSHHFQAVDVSYKVLTNIQNGHVVSFYYQSKSFNLSVHFLPPQSQPLPYWQSYSEEQNKLFENLFVTKDEVISVEKELQNRQRVKNGNRVTSSNTHKMFMQKKNFESLFGKEFRKKKKKYLVCPKCLTT